MCSMFFFSYSQLICSQHEHAPLGPSLAMETLEVSASMNHPRHLNPLFVHSNRNVLLAAKRHLYSAAVNCSRITHYHAVFQTHSVPDKSGQCKVKHNKRGKFRMQPSKAYRTTMRRRVETKLFE